MPEPSAQVLVRVWDLPTRVFHWVLAALFVAAVVSGWTGGNAMVWHLRCGLSILALLLFRLVWGLVGGRWSRFASFLYSPRLVQRYLRGQTRPHEQLEVGHNPLGSASVFALLGLLALQVGTGLLANDDIATTGPLNRFVSDATAESATRWHQGPGKWLLLGGVGLHLAAIVYYRWRRRVDLLRPMLTGDKALAPELADAPASADSLGTRALALVVVLACGLVAAWVARLGG